MTEEELNERMHEILDENKHFLKLKGGKDDKAKSKRNGKVNIRTKVSN